MSWWAEVTTRLRALLERRRMERELDEEVAFHLERETSKLIDAGWEPDAARREARRRFGGVERHRERARDAWGLRWLDDAVRDVAVGLRRMARAPVFSLLAVVTLALGVGGTVALFSVVQGLLLRPLPYADTDRLRTFWMEYSWRGIEFDHLAPRVRAFEGLAAWSANSATLDTDAGSVALTVGVGSDELFDVLGAPARLGRTFGTDADRPGAEPVVVLSDGLWRDAFGADPELVGRRVTLDGEATTVVGVMPPDFFFPQPDVRAWVPLDLDPSQQSYEGNGWLNLLGRLRSDAGPAEVDAELARITAALGERFTYPEAWDKTRGAYVLPVREYLMGDVRPVLLLLMAAVGAMLLMAVTNVAALLLARTTDRRDEIGVRSALGAGRGRLVRQLVTEAVLLAGIAGALGVAVAVVGFDALVSRLPLGGGFASTLRLEWPVLLAAVAAAALLGCAAALAPAHRLLGRGRLASLRPGARNAAGVGSGRRGLQGVLVAAEVCVAVLLVTGATLLTRSVARLHGLDTGLRTVGVGAVDLVLTGSMPPEERGPFLDRVVERVAALPGIAAAGLVARLPLRDGGNQGPMQVEGRPELTGERSPNVYHRQVTPGTLAALDVEVLQGRGIEPGDGPGAPEVAVVNRRLSREMWPGEDPIGKWIDGPMGGRVRVVGVVEDVTLTGVRAEAPRVLWVPAAQAPFRGGAVLVFSLAGEGDAAAMLGPVRSTVRALDDRVAMSRPTTMADVVDASIADTLQVRFFLGVLATLALVVGAAGVYGVVAYAVSRRTAEYGIRMALGAGRSTVLRGVLGREIRPVIAGVVAGVVLAAVASRAVAGLLWEVAPADPVSLATGAVTLLGVGLLAAVVPIVRATSIAPVEALREG